jgi:hypothetical protein
MAYNLIHPLYPMPALALGGTSYLTSQIVTVTSGSTTATGYTPGSVGDIQLVSFDIFGDDIRCYWEGSTPTASTGHVLPGGTAYTWSVNQWNNARFILSAGGTGAAVITASPFNGG